MTLYRNEPGVCVITLVETPDGTIAVQHKFDPAMTEARMDTALADAAAVALGSIASWAEVEPDEQETPDDDD